MKGKRVRTKPGNVVAIPLSNGRFAFGRLMKDSGIAIHKVTHKSLVPPDFWGTPDVLFYTSFVDNRVKDGSWRVVGMVPFETEDEAFPPPSRNDDVLNRNHHMIYHKGVLRDASEAEVQGLEFEYLWGSEALIEEIERRLVGDLMSQQHWLDFVAEQKRRDDASGRFRRGNQSGGSAP